MNASAFRVVVIVCMCAVKPPIKETLREDKPPYKGQSRNTIVVYTLCTKSLRNLYRAKWLVPNVSFICTVGVCE